MCDQTIKNNTPEEMISMPDGTSMPFSECLDNLLYTRDIGIYLDTLTALRKRYLIVLSIKDITGHQMPEQIFQKIHKLGFSKLTKWMGRTYVGVIDRGNVIFDQTGEKANLPTEFSFDNGIISVSAISQSHTWGISEIKINGINYSMNSRGWNIAVFDYETGNVIDSSTYDSYTDHPTFYHKNFNFDKDYFDSHFFVPEKYKEIWESAYGRSYFSNEKLGVKELENGILLPNKAIGDRVYGGVCDENFNLIAGHLTQNEEPGTRVRYISGSYKADETEIEFIDETAVYGGPMMNHLGHLITELFMSRIWWYLQNPNPNYKIAVTLYAGSSNKAVNFIKEFCELSGISEEQLIVVDKPSKFKKIIIPDQCTIPLRVQLNYSFTNEFFKAFEKIRLSIAPSEYKKIYFTKSKAGRGNVIGEDFFIDFYRKKGYEIINPEDYTLREKAAFLAGADEFASMIGTNSHYEIFCKPTARITLLSRTDNQPHPVQAFINEAVKNKNLYCVNVSIGFFHKYDWDGLSFMGVTNEFIEYVREVFDEEPDITPEQYLRDNLYDYFYYILQYYSRPTNFNYLKNQKMITMLQNMSEVFLGRDFDTSGLDLHTSEDDLKDRAKQLTDEISSLNGRISELENTDVYKTAKLIEETNKSMIGQIAAMQKSFSDETALHTEIGRLKDTNTQLRLSLSEAELTAKMLTDDLSQQKAELRNEKETNIQLRISLSQSKSTAESLSDTIERQKADLKNEKETAERLRASLNQAQLTAEALSKDLERQKADFQTERENLTQRIIEKSNEMNTQIANMQASFSWRITKPLRYIRSKFRK